MVLFSEIYFLPDSLVTMRFFRNNYHELEPGARTFIDLDKWKQVIEGTLSVIVQARPPEKAYCDGGLYVGCAGIGYMMYHVAQSGLFPHLKTDLLAKAEIYYTRSAATLSKRPRWEYPGFLFGLAGTTAVGSAMYRESGRQDEAVKLAKDYERLSEAAMSSCISQGSDELFIGRAGYVCGALFLNNVHRAAGVSRTRDSVLF